MTADDIGRDDLTGLQVPHDGEPQDELSGQPQVSGPELDAYGLPVQDRPGKKGRTYFLVTAALVCSIAGTSLGLVQMNNEDAHRTVNGHLVGLSFIFSLLALIPWVLLIYASDGNQPVVQEFLQEKLGLMMLGRAAKAICVVAGLLGLTGLFIPLIIHCPTCAS
jgi:hypothetical protein